MLTVTRTSRLTGIERSRSLPITEAQLAQWQGGGLIQNVFPDLSADDREFIMTGVTADEWDTFMGDNDE